MDMLASTLVTTSKHSRVHSNVASHGLFLLLHDAKAGCFTSVHSSAHVST